MLTCTHIPALVRKQEASRNAAININVLEITLPSVSELIKHKIDVLISLSLSLFQQNASKVAQIPSPWVGNGK